MSYIVPNNLDVINVTASNTVSASYIYGDGSYISNIATPDLSSYAKSANVSGSFATLSGVSSSFVSNDAATSSLARLSANNNFTNSQRITGSLFITSAISASTVTGSFSGDGSQISNLNLTGYAKSADVSSSFALKDNVSSSFASLSGLSSSFASLSGLSSSFVANTSATSSLAQLSVNNNFTNSQRITGSLFITSAVSSSAFTGSLFTGSFKGDGSQLTNVVTADLSPYAKSADVSSSFALKSSVSSSFVSYDAATASLARLSANNTFTGTNKFQNFLDFKIYFSPYDFSPQYYSIFSSSHNLFPSCSFFGQHPQNMRNGLTGGLTHGSGLYVFGDYSRVCGSGSISYDNALYSIAEGKNVITEGPYSHAEGVDTLASNTGSHAEGLGTIADANYQHVQGKYNKTGTGALLVVGNGTSGNRSNIFEVHSNKLVVSGSIFFGASGNGIDFSNTANGAGATSVAEIFDDYEEGSWTPQFTATSYTITTDSNPSNTAGWYTKIGNVVFFKCVLLMSSKTGTAANSLLISGLPFTSAATQNGWGPCYSSYANSLLTQKTSIFGEVLSGSTNIYIKATSGNASSYGTNLLATEVNSNFAVTMAGFYTTTQ